MPEKLALLEQALAATGYEFAHFGWSRAPGTEYGTWAEEGADEEI